MFLVIAVFKTFINNKTDKNVNFNVSLKSYRATDVQHVTSEFSLYLMTLKHVQSKGIPLQSRDEV